ncbi:2-hydroxyacyl-CoA dehydratase [Vallitalea pronyensis]|uniref:2-hydroxyacyl-CoA dehydratase n=1 Tax=Vallitalea pronyensis TaxID=1348613 RepID=A0A8J8SG00_9FIRM|nr:2-hydroxyacyl-CoA dehydratase family protein [Vallitalea pronyensis]QUI21867.1 2-hydroxyacyl-CoA dehydratase [Vallitalea pronyensis]
MCKYMELRSAQLIVKNQLHIYLEKMWEEHNRIVWTNMVMPTELFYAASLIPINTELIAGWLATLKLSSKYITHAHAMGYNRNLCSYHKAVIGALECGHIPPPKIAIFSSHICDGGGGMIRYFERRFNTKVLLIDIPYKTTKENIACVMNQLVEAKVILEKYTNQSIERHQLKKAIFLSNQARNYMQEANNLRKKDTLFYGNLAIRNLYGATFLFGSELGREVTKNYYHQLMEIKEKRSNSYMTDKQPYRILWIHFAPLYANDIMGFFEETLNCVIAFDITGYIYWDKLSEDNPVHGMAIKAMSHFYLGDVSKRIRLYKSIIHAYRIDGMVMFMHQGCRAIPGSSWEIRQIAKEIKMPFLELSGDCIDDESFSSEQMKLRMEAFSESMEMRRYVYGD